MIEAVINVIVDQLPLCIGYRVFDGVKLLSQLEARLSRLDHANNGAQMTLGSLETFDDVGMAFVFHVYILPWGIGLEQDE